MKINMNIHMMLLLVVMGVTLFFFDACDYKEGRKRCIQIVTVILALFSGLRSWWYADLIKYYTQYRNILEYGLKIVFRDDTNIGLRFVFYLAGRTGISFEVVLFVIALFSAVALGYTVYKYSPHPYWSYLMYISLGFYMFTYSGLKQTIAMGFVLLAGCAIFESKPIKFFVYAIIAGLFHAPAFIFLPAYLIAKKKMDALYLLILILAALFIYLGRNQIISIATTAYYEEEATYQVTKTIGGKVIMMAMILILGLLLRPARNGDANYCILITLMIMAMIIQYFSIFGNVFTRLADYYYQFVVLYMPMILESGNHQLKMNKDHKYLIRSYNREVYMLLGLGVTVFALWFYNNTLDSILISSFKFFWEINPYNLYGA